MASLGTIFSRILFFSISCVVIFSSCDEDFVQSLSTEKPVISLEVVDDLEEFYLGEPVDDVEFIVEVRNSPPIEFIFVTANFNSDYLQSSDNPVIIDLDDEDHLFYTENPDIKIEHQIGVSESSFQVSIGIANDNQDSTYAIGDGKIASFFLSGINGRTEVDLNSIGVTDWEGEEIDIDSDGWIIESPILIGAPIPKLYFNDITYDNDRIKMVLYVEGLPKVTQSNITINYNNSSDIFNFNASASEGGDLLSSGNVELDEDEDGTIDFDFYHNTWNQDVFFQGDGSLAHLSFDVTDIDFSSETSPLSINFNAMFNSAIFDICGDCGSDADYGEYWLYEDLSYWNILTQDVEIHFGCTDSNACTCETCPDICNNCGEASVYENYECISGECLCYDSHGFYNPSAIIDDGSCE